MTTKGEETKLPTVIVSASCGGSADALEQERKRGYAKGYAAALKRLGALEEQIAKLREQKDPPPPPSAHDVTIEYVLTTAEAMTGAATMLIEMRTGKNPPNIKAEASRQ